MLCAGWAIGRVGVRDGAVRGTGEAAGGCSKRGGPNVGRAMFGNGQRGQRACGRSDGAAGERVARHVGDVGGAGECGRLLCSVGSYCAVGGNSRGRAGRCSVESALATGSCLRALSFFSFPGLQCVARMTARCSLIARCTMMASACAAASCSGAGTGFQSGLRVSGLQGFRASGLRGRAMLAAPALCRRNVAQLLRVGDEGPWALARECKDDVCSRSWGRD